MTTNHIADELRHILSDLDHGPMSGPLRRCAGPPNGWPTSGTPDAMG
jgi:hypothetical protein